VHVIQYLYHKRSERPSKTLLDLCHHRVNALMRGNRQFANRWQCQNIDAGPLSLARYFVSLLYFAVSGTYLLVFVSIMLILSRHLIRWAICNAINRMQIAMLTNANAIVSKSIAVYRGFRQKKDVLMKSTRYSHSFFFD